MRYIGLALVYSVFVVPAAWLVTTGHPWFALFVLLCIPSVEAVPEAYRKTRDEMDRQVNGGDSKVEVDFVRTPRQ